MEFVLGAVVFMVGVLVGAAIAKASTEKPSPTKIPNIGMGGGGGGTGSI